MNLNDQLPERVKKHYLELLKDTDAQQPLVLRHEFIIEGESCGVRSFNATSDNRYIIITFENSDGRICIMDLCKLDLIPHRFSDHIESVRMTSISKDDRIFYTASWDGTSRCYEIATGKCTQILGGIGRSPSCFLDQEQKYLFTGSYDSDIDIDLKNTGRCWLIENGDPLYFYKHSVACKKIECIDIAYDQKYVYTGSDDGLMLKWNLTGKNPVIKYFEIDSAVRKIEVTGRYLAAACTDGFIRVHWKDDGTKFRYLLHSGAEVRDVRISADETRIYSASADGSVKCFNLENGNMLFHSQVHNDWIWSLKLMTNNNLLITGSRDGSVAFISSESGNLRAKLQILKDYSKFLFICPPDNSFTNGFFYTNNTDLIEVKIANKGDDTDEILLKKDPRRVNYIKKLNLKNLVITRLKNSEKYTSLTREYINNKDMGSCLNNYRRPPALEA